MRQKWMRPYIYLPVLILVLGAVAWNMGSSQGWMPSLGGNLDIVGWRLLHQLNYETGEAPEQLKKYDGQRVKIPGFIVPLSDDYSILEEFLLVPDAQSCIHVPPPPPNLIVHVKLRRPVPAAEVYNPSWAIGTLQIKESRSIHGRSSFYMDAERLEPYMEED